ncbi:MAG: type II toxin-antitoxin system HicA family toxin [Anaerolineaceae bacterium]|nr:type II toxin-antitoxin system HicA family toxin [Anaerolineaceae bacterium]
MKRRDLIKLLEENGFVFIRNGGNHDIYIKGVKKKKLLRDIMKYRKCL